MKKYLSFQSLFFLVVLVTTMGWAKYLPVHPERILNHRALRVVEVNTNAFPCDGKHLELSVDVRDARIRKIYFWFGTYAGTFADVNAVMVIDAAGQPQRAIAKMNWDRYAEPTGVAGETVWFDYTPDWIELREGEQLKMYAMCNPLNEETKTKKAHVIALVYYQNE